MKRLIATSLIMGGVSLGGAAHADCVDDSVNAAVKLCGALNNAGVRGELKANAEAKGQLSDWLSKILKPELNGGISGDLSSYVGPLHEQLTTDRFNVLQCRSDFAKTVISNQCHKQATFRTCTREEFGANGWQFSAEREGSSGWRQGGHTQAEYCSEVAAAGLAENQAGPAHSWETLGSGENRRRHWGNVSYNYHCKVRLNWGPIYNVRTDPLCGVEVSQQ